jgi:hypothetical protein
LALDHFRLNKFSNPNDGNYRAVRDEIKRLVKEAPQKFVACRHLGSCVASTKQAITSQTPFETPNFCGRSLELEQMRHLLDPTSSGRKAVVLWGLGGSGKTQLALRFRTLFSDNYVSKFWVDSTNLDSAVESIMEIAVEAGGVLLSSLISPHMPVLSLARAKHVLSLFRRWLECKDNTSWLMIIDSVEDLDNYDIRFLLPQCNHGTVIVTSTRSETASALNIEGIEVSEIDDVAGVDILLRKHDLSQHDEGRSLP